MSEKKSVASVITPEFRVSFANVFTPRDGVKNDDGTVGKKKYSLTMLWPKSTDLAKLKAAVVEAIKAEWGDDAAKWPTKTIDVNGKDTVISALRMPFRKGTEKDYEGYGPDVIFASATSINRPGLLGPDRKKIISPDEFYSGCYAIADVRPYAYKVKGNLGITFALNHILKMRDGEPFSGAGTPENAFDSIPLPTGAAASPSNPSAIVGAAADPFAGV